MSAVAEVFESPVLVVEDDPVLGSQLHDLLSSEGYAVDVCTDGESGLKMALEGRHQLLLLDVMMPKLNGFELLSQLRKSSQMPVVIVSAKGAEEERITGLRRGADDYLAKPFNSQELLLRIEALLRRCSGEADVTESGVIRLGELSLDRSLQRVFVGEVRLEVTPIEFKLLRALMNAPGEILSKALLCQTVLNRSHSPHDRSLDMHLSRIRRKLHSAGWDGARLQTVHGKGYLLS